MLPLTVQPVSVSVAALTLSSPPPPLMPVVPVVLLAMVQSIKVAVPALYNPPPSLAAEFPLSVQFTKVICPRVIDATANDSRQLLMNTPGERHEAVVEQTSPRAVVEPPVIVRPEIDTDCAAPSELRRR